MKDTMRFREIVTKYVTHSIPRCDDMLSGPDTVARVFRELYGDATEEYFLCFCLDNRNKLNGYVVVSKGTLNESLVHPREVFKAAIVMNCASIIIAHNHPSGHMESSSEDKYVAKRLAEAGRLLGIRLLDSVIVDCSSNAFYSMKSKGEFES